MPTHCYLCDSEFNDSTTVKHGEHVIQDSIGGALISYDILCEECGNTLGKTVDTQFAKALSPLTILLQTSRDHGEHSQVPTRLVANTADATPLEQLQFVLKSDFSVIPRRPFFHKDDTGKVVTVFAATLEQAAHYAKANVVQSALTDGSRLELSVNAAIHAERLLVNSSPDSLQVLRGMLKIAIGYAYNNGVEREAFAHLLVKGDLTYSEKILRNAVFSYYPVDDVERFFETEKHTHEDWYPTHHLYLFSHGSNLYCYVDLFGVLQKYVHLSSTYRGTALIEKFVQKAERWDFNESIFTAKDLKDLDILAGQFDVKVKRRSWDDIQTDVLNEARRRAYSLDPNDTVEKVQNLVLTLANFSFLKNGKQLDIVQSIFDKADAAKLQLKMTLLDDLRENPLIAMKLLQYKYGEFRMGNIKSSRPDQVRKVPQGDLERYTTYKFYELLRAKGRETFLQYEFIPGTE